MSWMWRLLAKRRSWRCKTGWDKEEDNLGRVLVDVRWEWDGGISCFLIREVTVCKVVGG